MEEQAKPQDVLDALKKVGVTSLDQLAEYAAKTANEQKASNQPIAASAIINHNWFVTA